MAKTSAGILPYRRRADEIEVFLVHPGGPYWANRDRGAWMIPKGLIEADEDPLQAARREFAEETGFAVEAPCLPLEPIRQKGGKLVYAWIAEMELDPDQLESDTFTMEWPPHSGQQGQFPEVDRARWFPLPEARTFMLVSQRPLLDQLEKKLNEHR